MVDAVLYVAVDKRLKIIDCVVYAVVGYAPLREVVCADFGRAVAG